MLGNKSCFIDLQLRFHQYEQDTLKKTNNPKGVVKDVVKGDTKDDLQEELKEVAEQQQIILLLIKPNDPIDGIKGGVKGGVKEIPERQRIILELIIADLFLSAKATSEKTSEKIKITNRTIESDWA